MCLRMSRCTAWFNTNPGSGPRVYGVVAWGHQLLRPHIRSARKWKLNHHGLDYPSYIPKITQERRRDGVGKEGTLNFNKEGAIHFIDSLDQPQVVLLTYLEAA